MAHAYIFLATFIIAGGVVACKEIASLMHPLPLTLLRFLLAAFSLLPIILCKASRRQQLRRAMPRSLVISFFYSMFFVFMFVALRTTTMLHVGSISTLAPLFTAFFSWIIFGTSIGWKKFSVYLLAMFATLIVVFDGSLKTLLHFSVNEGDLFFFMGTVLISMYYIVLKVLNGGIETIVLAFCTVIGGSIWISLGMLIMHVPFVFTGLNSTSAIASLLYLAIASTSLTAYLMQKGSVIISPNSTSAYQYLSPVLVSMLGVLILGVMPSLTGWIGSILSVIATIFLLRMSRENNEIVEK